MAVVVPEQRVAAAPTGLTMVGRAYRYFIDSFRRTWRGWFAAMFVLPVLNLLAFGYGLGALVGQDGGLIEGVTYAAYIAPGVLAATALMTSVEEGTWAVMTAVKWQRTYHAMLATPLTVRELLAGHLAWSLTRVVLSSGVLLAVMAGLGLTSWWGLLTLPAMLLFGIAVSGWAFALGVSTRNEEPFVLVFRFVIIPMTLFSGTYFPISQLPDWLEALAHLSPLWHAVELTRDLSLGQPNADDLVHVAVLVVLAIPGLWLADRAYRRRLVV